MDRQAIDLSCFRNPEFKRGRGKIVEMLWMLVSVLLVESWLPGNWHRKVCLRLFGAHIGSGVVLKPGVKIKFPWKFTIRSNSWIGERVWIDNLDRVDIADNCCVSQDAYLCTGSHNWRKSDFPLMTAPISLENGAWVGARAVITSGSVLAPGTVITAGSVFSGKSKAWGIYQGNPATFIKNRALENNLELK